MKRTVLALVSALALGSVAYANPTPANAPNAPDAAQSQGKHHRHGNGERFGRIEHKLDRMVEKGRISPEQGQKFKGEAERIRAEVESLRAQNGGKLSPEQKEHVKSEMRALRDELRAAKAATAPTKQG